MEKTLRVRDWIRDWGTLTTVVFFGVTQWMKVERHEGIISAYESHGTPQVVAMKATYDERFANDEGRLNRLENIATANASRMEDIRADQRAALEKLSALKELIDRIEPKGNGK